MLVDLDKIWRSLVEKYCSDEAIYNSIYCELFKAYGEPHRKYHSLKHIKYLVELFTVYEKHLLDKKVVLFSIFYHDIIYQPGYTNNEEKSANWAVKDLRELHVNEDQIAEVKAFIQATKNHQLVEVEHKNDLQFFLDFDRSILGADKSSYKRYVQEIRYEFQHLSDAVFAQGRAAFLKNLLAKPYVFYTKLFKEQYEQQAQENIKQELIEWLRHT